MTKKEWIVEITPKAQKDLKKLDRIAQGRVLEFLERLVIKYDAPTDIGTELVGTRKGLRRYHVGDWRVICELFDHKVTILVLQIGHRKDIYDFLH